MNEKNIIKNSIEDFRKKEINRIKRSKEYIPLENEFDGKKNYFIDQKKKSGRILDYALLYGDRLNKTFIGFQFKCYFNETKSINDKFVNKDKIKEKCKKILFNSMSMFDCKITQWH